MRDVRGSRHYAAFRGGGGPRSGRGADRGAAVDLGTPKQRALVAALALSPGRPVAVDTIVDLLWGESPPASVSSTLQGYISTSGGSWSRVDRDVEPRPCWSPWRPATRSASPAEQRGRAGVRGDGRPVPDLDAGVSRLGEGADIRRRPGTDRRGPGRGARTLAWDAVRRARRRAVDHSRTHPARGAAAGGGRGPGRPRSWRSGRHLGASAELEMLTARHPLRERLWALRAVALQRSGRQADALAALRELREVLDTELALDPSPELRDLETALLRQDAELNWMPPARGARPHRSPERPPPSRRTAVGRPRRPGRWPGGSRSWRHSSERWAGPRAGRRRSRC